jgi:ketosteroid isomerase-like protein
MKKSLTGSVLLAASLACSAQTPPEEDSIRNLRSDSNRALVAGDITAFAASLAEDFVVVVGNGSFLSRDAYIAAFAKDFKDPSSVRFERIVDSIELSGALPIAAEHGHWIGHLPDGRAVFSGTYLAMWRKSEGTWKLRSELFICLACEDAQSCEAYRKRYSSSAK